MICILYALSAVPAAPAPVPKGGRRQTGHREVGRGPVDSWLGAPWGRGPQGGFRRSYQLSSLRPRLMVKPTLEPVSFTISRLCDLG